MGAFVSEIVRFGANTYYIKLGTIYIEHYNRAV